MRLAVIAAALAAAALAACGDKPPQPRVDAQPAATGGTAAATSGTSATTSSSTGQASREERKDGANPVQQQVDPKQKEQRRDFEMRGDQQGPKSAETQPKN